MHLVLDLFPNGYAPKLHLYDSINISELTCFKSAVFSYFFEFMQILLDRCAYDDGRSYFPGYFSQDIMRASAYKYASVENRHIKDSHFNLLIVDRLKKRGFKIHEKMIDILVSIFPVEFVLYCYYRTSLFRIPA